MKTNVTEYDFVNWFANSECRKEQFSRGALFALYDYLIQLEEDTGEEFDFDPIALCCVFTEYETAREASEQFGYDEAVDLTEHGEVDSIQMHEIEEKQALEWLQERTQVIEFDEGIVIQNF